MTAVGAGTMSAPLRDVQPSESRSLGLEVHSLHLNAHPGQEPSAGPWRMKTKAMGKCEREKERERSELDQFFP